MGKSDWKDKLGSMASENIGEPTSTPQTIVQDAISMKKKQDFIIRFEKRNGKPATIVSNFNGKESELKELATVLKKHCGVGGSAKDDEILIQGDVRLKVANYLKAQGHLVRGDFKK
jgi:translation initiation factor 1